MNTSDTKYIISLHTSPDNHLWSRCDYYASLSLKYKEVCYLSADPTKAKNKARTPTLAPGYLIISGDEKPHEHL